MQNPVQQLKDLQPEKEFFVGIDSDGCVFDTMEIKHKECFCPNYINYFNLQRVSKYAREVWEFVNLYSKTRGANRFKALVRAIELLEKREEVIARNTKMLDFTPVKEWIAKETKLGNPTLKEYAAKNNIEIINLIYEWSVAVNEDVAKMVHDIPPFPFVKESLEKLTSRADAIVVSQTPVETLTREWEEHSIDGFVRLIAGQEYGTKKEHLAYAAGDKYDRNKILMVGDAPGDYKAAAENGFLFYPIIPGHEEESWEKFYNEAIDKFFNLEYEGTYQEKLLEDFENSLPENPPWEKTK